MFQWWDTNLKIDEDRKMAKVKGNQDKWEGKKPILFVHTQTQISDINDGFEGSQHVNLNGLGDMLESDT